MSIKERQRYWEAVLSGKEYIPLAPKVERPEGRPIRSILAAGMNPIVQFASMTNPKAYDGLHFPFEMMIGKEVVEITGIDQKGTRWIRFLVNRGVKGTPATNHTRGVKVKMI